MIKLLRFGTKCSMVLRGFLAIAAVAAFSAAAEACPSCKQALATADKGQGDVVGAYMWSILFMLSMPFALIGTFGFSMWRAVKKANASKESGTSAELGSQGVERQADSEQG